MKVTRLSVRLVGHPSIATAITAQFWRGSSPWHDGSVTNDADIEEQKLKGSEEGQAEGRSMRDDFGHLMEVQDNAREMRKC